MVLAGCSKGTDIIWSSKEISPDGVWIATAKTSQNAGPGTASVSTEVDLTSAHSAYPPFIILGFTNTTAYPVGVTAVKMKWITNSHLDVIYNSDAVLEFQAIKASGVTITARQTMAAKQ